MNGNYFNTHIWKPALEQAKVETTRENGMHALRHHYASVLLDSGESIKAVSEFLGHAGAGFTLAGAYTHLMPSSDERTRKAIDNAFACYMAATSDPEIHTLISVNSLSTTTSGRGRPSYGSVGGTQGEHSARAAISTSMAARVLS